MSNQALPIGFAVFVPLSIVFTVIGSWCFLKTAQTVQDVVNSNSREQQHHRMTMSSSNIRRNSMNNRSRSKHSSAEWVLFLTVFCSGCFLFGLILCCIYNCMVVYRIYRSDNPSNKRAFEVEDHSDLKFLWRCRITSENIGFVCLVVISYERLQSIFKNTQYALGDCTVKVVRYCILGGLFLILLYRVMEALCPGRYVWLLVVFPSLGYPILVIWIAYQFYHKTRLIATSLSSVPKDEFNKNNSSKGQRPVMVNHDSVTIVNSTTTPNSMNAPSSTTGFRSGSSIGFFKGESFRATVEPKVKQPSTPRINRLKEASLRLTIVTFVSTATTLLFIMFFYVTISMKEGIVIRLVGLFLFGFDSFVQTTALLMYFSNNEKYYLMVYGPMHQCLSNQLEK